MNSKKLSKTGKIKTKVKLYLWVGLIYNCLKYSEMGKIRNLMKEMEETPYYSIGNNLTVEQFLDAVEQIKNRSKPTKEKPFVYVVDRYTIKNDGEFLYLLSEDKTWNIISAQDLAKKINFI